MLPLALALALALLPLPLLLPLLEALLAPMLLGPALFSCVASTIELIEQNVLRRARGFIIMMKQRT
jgi:hypothetical protein